MQKREEIIEQVTAKVREFMAHFDGSHDFFHVRRVCISARKIAKAEGVTGDEELFIIELAALLHDVNDWKYKEHSFDVAQLLSDLQVPVAIQQRVLFIIDNLGFRSELEKKLITSDLLFKIVQDADRLDAIGAVGIARAFAYGGAKGRLIYDPNCQINKKELTQEEYSRMTTPTINHFFHKLLRLKDMMKTNTGKQMAESRHSMMGLFLQQFFEEASEESSEMQEIHELY